MSLTLYLALITLAPIVLGALIYLAAKVQLATTRIVLGVAIIAALFPVVGLPFLARDVGFGLPIAIRPFGLGSGFGAWIIPTYRIDTFALYAAMGVAYLIVPLLIWLAFQERGETGATANDGITTTDLAPADDPRIALPATPVAVNGHDVAEDGAPSDPHTMLDVAERDAAPLPSVTGGTRVVPFSGRKPAAPALVRSVALVLALETLTLSAVLADGIAFLGIAWILLAIVAWGIGETASDSTTIDRPGVFLTIAGPLFWLIVMLFPARAVNASRLLDLTGRTAFNPLEIILLALALALASGAYPFMVWVRRRAAFATPAGLGALVLIVAPAVLYVGARTYSVAVIGATQWPLFGATPAQPTTPAPINSGIAFVVLGTATVVAAGLLALSRRDARPLVALLATAQIGWGLVGIGSGVPISLYAVVVLLATSTLGLGAMLAALAAGGVITSDLEPSADGPRAVGEPARPLALVAWCIGAATLIGAPLLPGFIPRQLMSVGILRIQGLGIPLLGLCWVGDALLALALLRAIAPALVNPIADATTVTTRAWVIGARDIPAAVLAALALLVGIAPALLLGGFSGVATVPVLGLETLGGLVFTNPLGYGTNASQWAVGVAWITLVLVAVVLYIMRPSATRAPSPAFTGGHDAGTAQDLTSASEDESLASPLTEPAQAWADLRPAFDSPWALPGGDWLLAGADDEESDDEAALAHDEPVAAEPVSVPVPAHAEEVADGER